MSEQENTPQALVDPVMAHEEKNDQDQGVSPLQMNLQFDETCEMFVLSYLEGDKALFQVKMTPGAFEKMTADMVRTVKNYNLFQAEKFKEKINEQKDNATADNNSGSLPDSCCAHQPCEGESEQPKSDS